MRTLALEIKAKKFWNFLRRLGYTYRYVANGNPAMIAIVRERDNKVVAFASVHIYDEETSTVVIDCNELAKLIEEA